VSSNEPVRNGCEVIYETVHISLHIHGKINRSHGFSFKQRKHLC